MFKYTLSLLLLSTLAHASLDPVSVYKECVETFVVGDCTDMTFKECYMKAYIEGAMCVVERQGEK